MWYLIYFDQFINININIFNIIKMAAILIGSITFFVLYVVAAYFISDRVTRDEPNEKLRSEYRKYINLLI